MINYGKKTNASRRHIFERQAYTTQYGTHGIEYHHTCRAQYRGPYHVFIKTHALVLGMIYPLKSVNYAETQNYVRSRCLRT